MKLVFADAAYWIALVNPNDQWFEAAVAAYEELGPDAHLVTTEEVLTEVLNNFSRDGRRIREKAVEQVWTILNADDVTVHGQTHDSFLAGLQRYELRSDKSFSLTDCISMVVMEEEGVQEVLTPDQHFRQAGFHVLMR